MTSTQPCPTWCTIHDDPAWSGPHHGDPIDIAAVIEHEGTAMPASLVLTRTANFSGEWIQLQAEDTALLDLRLDLSTATRLTYAIDLATKYAVWMH